MVYDMDCPHCARPLEYVSEYKDVVYRSQNRELNVIYFTNYRCTFCPVTVEVSYKMPTEYYPLGLDVDSSDSDHDGP